MNSWTFLYPLLKSGHILAMAAWVGGTIAVVMLVAPGGRLPTMEAQSAALRVMRFVVNPALFITLALGTAVDEVARGILADNPLGAAREYGRSLAWGFAFEEASLARYRHTVPAISADNHARLEVLLQGSWTALLASAALGIWARLRQGLADPVALYTLALLAAIGLSNVWFEFGERHRLVLTPFLLLIAADFWIRQMAGKTQR